MLDVASHRPALLPKGHAPVMCVVVDTEEEFDWTKPFSRQNVSVASIAAQILAHEQVFDRFGVVPTYVVDWPVATTFSAFSTLKSLMDEGRCEIGTHLHPWVSPPYMEEVNTFHSYAGNLPGELEFKKLSMLTDAISENFKRQPIVFKAGRYGLGQHTSGALQQLGYSVDASVVPHTSFKADGGPDFSDYGNQPYWFGEKESLLLELPVTTGFCGVLRRLGPKLYPHLLTPLAKTLHFGGIFARTGFLERIRLTPEGTDTAANLRLMDTLVRDGVQVITLAYHSPSLVPGKTPYVKTVNDLRHFLNRIAECCDYFQNNLGGIFMSPRQIRQHMVNSLGNEKCNGQT